MSKRLKKWGTMSVAAVALAGAAVVAAPASPAVADTRCEAEDVYINGNPGWEPGSWASGHSHNSGNHYVFAIWSDGLWDWYADNNGGNDGDTEDTYYSSRRC